MCSNFCERFVLNEWRFDETNKKMVCNEWCGLVFIQMNLNKNYAHNVYIGVATVCHINVLDYFAVDKKNTLKMSFIKWNITFAIKAVLYRILFDVLKIRYLCWNFPCCGCGCVCVCPNNSSIYRSIISRLQRTVAPDSV